MGGVGIILASIQDEVDLETGEPGRIKYKIRMLELLLEDEETKKMEKKNVWEEKKIYVADILRRTKKRKLEQDHLLQFNPDELADMRLTKEQGRKYGFVAEEVAMF